MASWWISLARSAAMFERRIWAASAAAAQPPFNGFKDTCALDFLSWRAQKPRIQIFPLMGWAETFCQVVLSVRPSVHPSVRPLPTCVQLPAGTGWNRWRCNGKSLSPLAAPAFPRCSHSRQPTRPDLRVCLQRRSVALPSALLYTFQGQGRQTRKNAFVVMFYSIFYCVLL